MPSKEDPTTSTEDGFVKKVNMSSFVSVIVSVKVSVSVYHFPFPFRMRR